MTRIDAVFGCHRYRALCRAGFERILRGRIPVSSEPSADRQLRGRWSLQLMAPTGRSAPGAAPLRCSGRTIRHLREPLRKLMQGDHPLHCRRSLGHSAIAVRSGAKLGGGSFGERLPHEPWRGSRQSLTLLEEGSPSRPRAGPIQFMIIACKGRQLARSIFAHALPLPAVAGRSTDLDQNER